MSVTNLRILAARLVLVCVGIGCWAWVATSLHGADADKVEKRSKQGPFDVVTPYISSDRSVKYDYDVVYVRTPRKGNAPHSSRWADASLPMNVDAGAT